METTVFSHAMSVYQDACLRLPHDFKRRRVFDTASTMMALMQLVAVGGTSYVRVLEGMAVITGWQRTPTPGALSHARGKVPMATTRDLWRSVRDAVRSRTGDAGTTVSGLRVVAIDGTWVRRRRAADDD